MFSCFEVWTKFPLCFILRDLHLGIVGIACQLLTCRINQFLPWLIMSLHLNNAALEDLLWGHSDFKRGAAEISQFGNLGIRNLGHSSEQNLDEVEMDMTWRAVKWTLHRRFWLIGQDTKCFFSCGTHMHACPSEIQWTDLTVGNWAEINYKSHLHELTFLFSDLARLFFFSFNAFIDKGEH